MRNLWYAALAAIVLAASPARADEVFGEGAFNTGPIVCSNSAQIATITNPHAFAIRVLRVNAWIGLDFGRAADLGFSAHRSSDGNMLFRYLLDRYGNPVSSNSQPQELSPGIVLQAGESVTVAYNCWKFNTTATVNVHFAFEWFWVRES